LRLLLHQAPVLAPQFALLGHATRAASVAHLLHLLEALLHHLLAALPLLGRGRQGSESSSRSRRLRL
jgi:hypothetical protein